MECRFVISHTPAFPIFNILLLLFPAVAWQQVSFTTKGGFLLIIGINLLLSHSLSEWFFYNKKPSRISQLGIYKGGRSFLYEIRFQPAEKIRHMVCGARLRNGRRLGFKDQPQLECSVLSDDSDGNGMPCTMGFLKAEIPCIKFLFVPSALTIPITRLHPRCHFPTAGRNGM